MSFLKFLIGLLVLCAVLAFHDGATMAGSLLGLAAMIVMSLHVLFPAEEEDL